MKELYCLKLPMNKKSIHLASYDSQTYKYIVIARLSVSLEEFVRELQECGIPFKIKEGKEGVA